MSPVWGGVCVWEKEKIMVVFGKGPIIPFPKNGAVAYPWLVKVRTWI